MRSVRSTLIPLLALVSSAALMAWDAFAPQRATAAPIPACTASDVIAADPGCPAAGNCNITKDFDVATGCVLDFGTRNVSISSGSDITIGSGAVTLRAGNFSMPGGTIDGTTSGIGGFIRIEASGDISVGNQPTGKILLNGDVRGGTMQLVAGGNVTIDGQLKASNSNVGASGGDVLLEAAGDVTVSSTSLVTVHGGLQSSGGVFDGMAGGDINIDGNIDAIGGEGGIFDMRAVGSVFVNAKLQCTGEGDAGSGGDIDIFSGADIEINDQLTSKGTGSAIDSGGGDGGVIFMLATAGDIIVRDEINVTAGSPDGAGGDIEFSAQGTIEIEPAGILNCEGNGPESDGGTIFLESMLDVLVDGSLLADGGDGGGDVDIQAGRDVIINNQVDAAGITAGSFGGAIAIEAGIRGTGALEVNADLDAGGAGCDTFGFCSLAGDIDLVGCDVTIAAAVMVDVRAGGSNGAGGTAFLVARDQMTVAGTIDGTGGTSGPQGLISIFHPTTVAPVITGTITPAPSFTGDPPCTGLPTDPPSCLTPCPQCGNNAVEFPETCDDVNGTPVSCDGCSVLCQTETCGDTNPCTVDLCDPVFGCGNVVIFDGTSCDDDATVCNGSGQCTNGTCSPIAAPNCDDGNPCTVDSCDPVTGCQNVVQSGAPCEDGDLCTENDTCTPAGVCASGNAVTCVDAFECTLDTCDPGVGCVFDPVPLVNEPCTDDGDPCTIDYCLLICQHQPGNDGGPCEDGDFCTEGETCMSGSCGVGTPVTCNPIDDCHDAGVCNPLTGLCSNPEKANGTPCDDGSLCTSNDQCQNGVCVGTTSVTCTPLDECHNAGVCDPQTGVCSDPPKPDGAFCDDGLFCTVESCQSGVCTPAPRDCGDGDACTTDSCDEGSNMCSNDPITPCCGNGVEEGIEECDAGPAGGPSGSCESAICLPDCTCTGCGDGIVDPGEDCDEGPANSNDPGATCRLNCVFPGCGDTILDPGEECDDGNTTAGDGCSPRCFLDPPPEAVLVAGRGAKTTDCVMEWRIEGTELDRKGLPSVKKTCGDGSFCDKDGVANGVCEFHVWTCSNNNDPNLPLCSAGNARNQQGLAAVAEVKKPAVRHALKNPSDALNRQELLKGAAAIPVGENFDVCGPKMVVRVPAKSPFKKGRKTIKMRVTTSRGIRDTDALKLTCVP